MALGACAAVETDPGVVLTYNDGFNMMYRSGTTGAPKEALSIPISSFNVPLALAVGFRINFGTVGIVTTPLYSNGTWMVWLTILMAGGRVVIMPKFDPLMFLHLVQRERVTHAFMVPTQYIVTMSAPGFDQYGRSSLQTVAAARRAITDEDKSGG